ncbi:ParM/StbA family protein [Thiomonas sp. FB-Cd]|uniref:ParM/StbA family protein n=1 Tax=Thiomonas sp. FB-Cd TaxID=1158292 RepID=UPI0004DF77C4|nr:ParM/StbA family protein [Thiomonas sp. FB-Cd]
MSLGIDIGRSGVKISAAGRHLPVFPAVACPALGIDDAAERERVRQDTIRHGDRDWFVGHAAIIHGRVHPANDAGFELSIEYEVLLRAALRQAHHANQPLDRIVLGVPSEAGSRVRDQVARQAGEAAPGASIRVVAQPAGALTAAMALHPGLASKAVAIIDVGRYSTDLAVSVKGRPVSGSLISLPGVRLAVDHLSAALRPRLLGTVRFETMEQALSTGILHHRLEHVHVQEAASAARAALTQVIQAGLARLMTLQPDIEVLLLSGGGADLLDPAVLPAHVRSPGGRFAVADGLSRIAAGLGD